MTKKKKICFIAQFPPPIHGLSKAVDTLYKSNLNDKFDFEKINITNNMIFPKNFMLIMKSSADLFYFTISQSKGGNIRDLIILKLISVRKKKCFIHLHGGYYRQLVDEDMASWQKNANYRAIKRLEGVIVLSDSLKNIFKGMIDDNRIHAVMNCVDDEFLPSDEEIKRKLEGLKGKQILRVLYLSNFIRLKGYREVLEMARIEKDRVTAGGERRFHFDFAGKFYETEEKQFFEGYVRENGLEDYVTYHGIVGGDEKRKLLGQADVFVLLTRYQIEGQPISILEAMGNAIMIVTTDHAGIPDIAEDGVNGIVCGKEKKIQGVYEILYKVTNDELTEIGLRNREYCKEMFTQEKYVAELGRIFTKGDS